MWRSKQQKNQLVPYFRYFIHAYRCIALPTFCAMFAEGPVLLCNTNATCRVVWLRLGRTVVYWLRVASMQPCGPDRQMLMTRQLLNFLRIMSTPRKNKYIGSHWHSHWRVHPAYTQNCTDQRDEH